MSNLRRFGIDPNPRTFEELRESYQMVLDLLSGFADSPDFLMGDRSVRVRFPEGNAAGMSVPAQTPASERAFYHTYTADPGGGERHYLQGGQVVAGDYTTTIPDTEIGTVGSEPADGTVYYLVIPGDGYAPTGQLLQGFDGSSDATVGNHPSAVPSNGLPTVSATSGTCYVLLGTWNGGVFTPAGPGNVEVHFCPGAFTVLRF